MAYLDHNATTPLDQRVLEAMLPYLGENYGNPSALYRRGRLARHAVEAAREQVAALVGAAPRQVIFTSGGTEANNLAIKGAWRPGGRVAVSAVEHASVLAPAQEWANRGGVSSVVAVDGQGRVKINALERLLSQGVDLVSVMMANNETGVLQDVAAVSERARAHGALCHTDAVQAAGKIAVDFSAQGVHMMTLSSHKLYGPKGVGALIVDGRLELAPLLSGGGQESGRRSGTENVAAIVGFGLAAELAAEERVERHARLSGLREYLEQRLARLGEVVVFGADAERLPNTVFLAIPGIEGEALLMILDKAGIEVSSGSACDSRKTEPSHVLLAMGVKNDLARCAIRVSLGVGNTRADIDLFIDELQGQLALLRSMYALSCV